MSPGAYRTSPGPYDRYPVHGLYPMSPSLSLQTAALHCVVWRLFTSTSGGLDGVAWGALVIFLASLPHQPTLVGYSACSMLFADLRCGAHWRGPRCAPLGSPSCPAGLSGCIVSMWHTMPAMHESACAQRSHACVLGSASGRRCRLRDSLPSSAISAGAMVGCIWMACPHAPRHVERCSKPVAA